MEQIVHSSFTDLVSNVYLKETNVECKRQTYLLYSIWLIVQVDL